MASALFYESLKSGPRRTNPPLFSSLDFVYSAIGHDRDLLRPSTLSADVGDLVQGLDAVDDVSKDTRELGVHVCQDNAKLGRNLRGKQTRSTDYALSPLNRSIRQSIPSSTNLKNIGLSPHLV